MKPGTPNSDSFWILASGYCDAGDAIHSLIRGGTYRGGFAFMPCIFLYFRSIELALKAILIAYKVPEREIARKLGHRISELMVRAEPFIALSDIGITGKDRILLDRFSESYSDKWFEYPDRFWKSHPKLDQLKDLARRVCDAVRTHPQR